MSSTRHLRPQYFAQLLGHRELASEINVCGNLWTARVTSHVPLREVADLITEDRIVASTRLLDRALRASGIDAPRIAIAALNPHAGEGGLLGDEEITTRSNVVAVRPATNRRYCLTT